MEDIGVSKNQVPRYGPQNCIALIIRKKSSISRNSHLGPCMRASTVRACSWGYDLRQPSTSLKRKVTSILPSYGPVPQKASFKGPPNPRVQRQGYTPDLSEYVFITHQLTVHQMNMDAQRGPYKEYQSLKGAPLLDIAQINKGHCLPVLRTSFK